MTEHPSPTPAGPLPVPPTLAGLATVAGDYDLVLCDVWGVVHNGVAAFPGACDALPRLRRGGAAVVLITNAPRPAPFIAEMLEKMGVPKDAYDAIVSSGDLTRTALADRPGAKVFHIGPERDVSTFDGLDVTLVPLAEAQIVVCTGLFDDDVETATDYAVPLAEMRARDLPFICANPDIVVARGDKLIYCAGAIAEAYEALGGEVLYFGKPYPAIYETALALGAAASGRQAARERILAIGDALHTDMAGAARCGFDGLFIASGIHAHELSAIDGAIPDGEALARLFAGHAHPRGVMPRLAW